MKHTAFLTLLSGLLSLGAFAQKVRISHQPKLFQASIRTGLLNSNLNVEYRLAPKTMLSVDFGIGIVYVHSHYYNRFNENYAEQDKYYDDFLNFGWNWWSTYTSLQIRHISGSGSALKYASAPYANTYFYYALQLKRSGRELQGRADITSMAPFRETYQVAALFGRQVEINKSGSLLFDFYMGLGAIANYKLTQIQPKWVMGTRIGFQFLEKTN